MDEAGARALLERLAADETPSHVDITAARAMGHRWRRRRRIALSATSLTAVAAATAVALSGVIPLAAEGAAAGRAASASRRAPVTPQPTFNVLVPYASFGWLPAGFSLSTGANMAGGVLATRQRLDMEAGSPATGHLLEVEVWAAGACQLRNHMSASQVKPGYPPDYYSARYPRRLAGACAGMPLAAAAPPVAGDPAFWTPTGGLAWEYAPGSWAHMAPRYATSSGHSGSGLWRYRANIGWRAGVKLAGHPATVQSAHTRALLLKVAAGVRYGGTTPVPFGFRLTGLPGSWQPQQAMYTTSGGRLVGSSLTETSAGSPYNLYVAVSPAGSLAAGSRPCDGPPPSAPKAQSLARILGPSMCKASYRGMTVRIGLMPGKKLWRKRSRPSPPFTPVSVFRHLRLLGPDPASWTTSPLS